MNVQETDWYSPLHYFDEEVANEHYREKRQRIYEDLLTNNDANEDAKTRFEYRREEAQRACTVRTTLMAAFLRYGELGSKTNWSFKSFFPLRTHDGKSADVLIGNESSGSIILAVILPIRGQPLQTVADGLEILANARENAGPLRDDIGVNFGDDRMNIAIVVDHGRGKATGEAIVELRSDNDDFNSFYVWRVVGPQGERFDLYTNFPSGDEHRHDPPLGDLLEEGIKVIDSPHSLPDFFYDVHHSQLLEHTVITMASNHFNTEIPTTHFSRKELRTYYQDTLYGPGSDNKAIQLVERIIERWVRMDIIKGVPSSDDKISDGSQAYRFISSKKNPVSIYDDVNQDYEKKSKEFLLWVRATRAVIDEYVEKVGKQSDFEEFSNG